MFRISAVIITLNEERNIERCLNSVKDVVDEIVIFDSQSTDRTVEIAKSFNAKIFQCEWRGYAATKNEANNTAVSDYILWLDADEALSDKLQSNILEIKNKLTGAYTINRLNNYCGKWIKHGGFYPDRKIRLFPKEDAIWEGDFVHEKLRLTKKITVSHIEGDILHYSYYSLSEHKQRINKYATLGAGRISNTNTFGSVLKMFVSPLFRFIKNYFIRLGFLDGYYGFWINYYTSIEVFLKYKKSLAIRK